MIDTHAHLNLNQFDTDRPDVIKRSLADLDSIVNIGVDLLSSQNAIALAKSNKNLFAAVGIHPEEVIGKPDLEINSLIEQLIKLLTANPDEVIAIGEIGLDYHYAKTNQDRELQKSLFVKQLEVASSCKMPIVIHSREAEDELVSLLGNYPNSISGIWHCFTGGIELANRIVKLGLLIGLNGILTFPSSRNLVTTVQSIELGKIVLETDCPFLAPQNYRGKRNEPWMVKSVAEKIAEIKGVSLEEVARVTDLNARRVFNLK